mmetsp:Transcript_8487/g.16177  ORF Transcript_8487/g.16177 Transcript_8487/m.16177 type:complete len:208 (+) Transcript_8487:274-897(+)
MEKLHCVNKIVVISGMNGITHPLDYPFLRYLVSYLYGVDVWLDMSPQKLGELRYPYPMVASNALGDPVLIATKGWGGTIGQLDLVFDQFGKLTDWEGKTKTLSNSTSSDKVLKTQVDSLIADLDFSKGRSIGFSQNAIFGERGANLEDPGCRFTDCPMGRLMTKAMRCGCPQGRCHFASINSGNIRASIPAGAQHFILRCQQGLPLQ